MAYTTNDKVKKFHGINWSAGLDTFVESLIAAATKYINGYCGDERFGDRVFEAPDPDTAVTRHFNGNGQHKIYIGDLRELVSLTVDGVELTVDEDFYLYPLNAAVEGRPYEWIELIQPSTRLNQNSRLQNASPYVFDEGQRTVAVEGKWGYSETVPDDIEVATIKLVGGMIKENIGDADLKEVTSKTLGEYSVSFAKVKDVAHLLGVDAMLTLYKRKSARIKGGIIQVS